MNLNKSQHCAIHHKDGAMLVLAGPGSGKTAVITQRTKNLIEEYNIPPSDILVITFTKAASNEMKDFIYLWVIEMLGFHLEHSMLYFLPS